ncbi:hypothetical protein WN944_021945 [Citrus x changshan-huyou]|uniref:Uncharacterized protein n=1 Tax=Citrus x changshan-huyou TaxID=2935761 RepID=A0AAP0R0V7_9ROSI
MALCFLQEIGLADDVLVDEQDIPAPVPLLPGSYRTHLLADFCHQTSAHHVWGSSYSEETAVVHKSSERQKLTMKGYRIIGNIGDQWSDLLGTNTGNRTFKLLEPMLSDHDLSPPLMLDHNPPPNNLSGYDSSLICT